MTCPSNGNLPVTGEFPAQKASNVEKIPYHGGLRYIHLTYTD